MASPGAGSYPLAVKLGQSRLRQLDLRPAGRFLCEDPLVPAACEFGVD